MTFPLATLPLEIILSHVAPFLSTEDLMNLAICGLHPFSKELYDAVFHDNTNWDHYDEELFRRREECSVYAIGDPDGGRLGTAANTADHFEEVDSLYRRMIVPFKLKSVGKIVQVATGDCLQMLNSKGGLFVTGEWGQVADYEEYVSEPTMMVLGFDWDLRSNAEDSLGEEEEEEKDTAKERGFVTEAWSRRPIEDNYDINESQELDTTECDDLLNSIFSSPVTPCQFREVASSESFFYGLDENGFVWEWTLCRHPRQGVPVHFTVPVSRGYYQVDGRLIPGGAGMLRVGLENRACFVKGYGIVTWRTRTHAIRWRNGYPCDGHHLPLARVEIVPHTLSGVKDFVMVAFLCVILRKDGTLRAVNLKGLEAHTRERTTHHGIENSMEKINRLGPFVQISGNNGNQFAVTCASGDAVIVEADFSPHFEVVQKVKIPRLATISVGKSHYLALTKDGEVYSWGTENCYNGCLGLGKLEDALKREGVRDGEDCLVVDEPVKIKLPKKVYAVFAGQGHSAFLM